MKKWMISFKIIKPLEESGLLIKEVSKTIKNEMEVYFLAGYYIYDVLFY